MKVLALGQFDPCCYHLRHRDLLAAHGIDLRVAVERVYWEEGHRADYVLGRGDDEDRCRAFARGADVLQFSPAIDQGWSFHTTEPRFEDPTFLDGCRGRRVALFHGSVNAAANAEVYAARYRGEGYALAATTLDYVHRMEAEYLPPIVAVKGRADLQRRHVKLAVIHSPTNRVACSTLEFLEAVQRLHVRVTVVTGRPHEDVLRAKRLATVGFDHVRGAFSINSLENAALGLVNLVGVRPEYREYLSRRHGVTLPWPEVETISEAADCLRDLAADVDKTRSLQRSAFNWFWDEWHPKKVAARVAETYRRLAQ